MIRILNSLFWMHSGCMFYQGNGDKLDHGIQIQASFFLENPPNAGKIRKNFSAGKILFISYMEVLLHLTA